MPADSASAENPLPRFQLAVFLLCLHVAEIISLGSLFIRALNPIPEAPTS